jgi:two-component system, chemotaxis family, chemotaxis protein CheY
MPDAFGLFTREHNGLVLVVDDDADVRKIVSSGLKKSGYGILEAKDGQEAIDVINSGENPIEVDVIICDIRMPKINGVEAIKYFHDQYPTCPVIVLTGFPDFELSTSLYKQGVVNYLVKPVEREKLAAAVEKAMKQQGRFQKQT